MAQTPDFLPPRVLQLMKQIETEKDRATLAQLFLELNLLVNEDERRVQPSKKTARSIGADQKRRATGLYGEQARQPGHGGSGSKKM